MLDIASSARSPDISNLIKLWEVLEVHLPYGITLTCFFLGGFALAIFGVLFTTTLQREIRPDRLSRVSAYFMFGSSSLLPIGFLMAAPLGAVLGRDGALWFGASFTILSMLVVLLVKDVRLLRRPVSDRAAD